MPRQITLIGNYGATNIGDEAILEGTLRLLRKISHESVIHVLSSNPHDTELRYGTVYTITSSCLIPFGFRSIVHNSRAFLQSITKLKASDTVLLGGGGLFTDKPSVYAVMLWFIHFFFFAKVLKKPVHIYAQSLGPVSTALGKWITTYVLKHSASISVRDELSLSFIKDILPGKYVSAQLVFDPALTLEETKESPKKSITDIEEVYTEDYTPLAKSELSKEDTAQHVAVSLRPWEGISHILHTLEEFFIHENSRRELHLHLIPMQYIKEEDVHILESLQVHLSNAGIISTLHMPHSWCEVMNILKTMDIAIGMRLHFLILSAISGTPMISLSYSAKINGFIEQIGMKNYIIPANTCTVEQLKETYRNILQEKDSLKKDLSQKRSSYTDDDSILMKNLRFIAIP